jgi:inorganic pyrophosphatase
VLFRSVAFIEVVTTDNVKQEINEENGSLKIDRPQKYSNVVPAIYGFILQTYCADVGKYCMEKSGKTAINGNGNPIDICVLTENTIAHGDNLFDAHLIGRFRMIDRSEADDKNIAALINYLFYRQV